MLKMTKFYLNNILHYINSSSSGKLSEVSESNRGGNIFVLPLLKPPFKIRPEFSRCHINARFFRPRMFLEQNNYWGILFVINENIWIKSKKYLLPSVPQHLTNKSGTVFDLEDPISRKARYEVCEFDINSWR